MRSRRSGPGRPSGDTKASGRRVTRKAPLAHVEGGSGRSEASPTAILKDTHSVEVWNSRKFVTACNAHDTPKMCRMTDALNPARGVEMCLH
jgi:hypothetical protein